MKQNGQQSQTEPQAKQIWEMTPEERKAGYQQELKALIAKWGYCTIIGSAQPRVMRHQETGIERLEYEVALVDVPIEGWQAPAPPAEAVPEAAKEEEADV